MSPELLALILAFERETAEMLRLFLDRAGMRSLDDLGARRREGFPRRGYLAGRPRILYQLHGIGLWLRIGNRKIDFDFGYDGRAGGFNDWWLWRFAEDRPEQFPELQDQERIKAALLEARQAGEIGKPFLDRYDSLEYRLISIVP